MDTPYKIAHLNIRGVGAGDTPKKAKIIISYMKGNKIDLMSLSETKTTPKNQAFFFDNVVKSHHNPHQKKGQEGYHYPHLPLFNKPPHHSNKLNSWPLHKIHIQVP